MYICFPVLSKWVGVHPGVIAKARWHEKGAEDGREQKKRGRRLRTRGHVHRDQIRLALGQSLALIYLGSH